MKNDLTEKHTNAPGPKGALIAMVAVLVPELFVIVLTGFATIGFAGLFATWSFLIPVVAAGAGVMLATLVARRFGLLGGETLLVHVVLFVIVGSAATQSLSLWSVPDFGQNLVTSWATLLSSAAPADLTAFTAPVPFTIMWLGGLLAVAMLQATKVPGAAIVGPFLAFGATTLFSLERRNLALAIGVGLIIGLIALTQIQNQKFAVDIDVDAGSSASPRRILLALGLVTLTAVGAPFLGQQLPLADAKERVDLRDVLDNTWSPLDDPSPLVTLKASLKEQGRDEVMFRVTGDSSATHWTVAAMESLNGIVWQVADPLQTQPAQFIPVDTELPATTVLAGLTDVPPVVTHTIEIVDLGGHWIPHAGVPRRIEFTDQSADLRMNLKTGTVALPVGFVAGDQYTVDSLLSPVLTEQEMAVVTFDQTAAMDAELIGDPVQNLAQTMVVGTDRGGPQVVAIQNQFRELGFYDIGPERPPGHAYADIADFVGEKGSLLIGYEEQYAATAALVARLNDIPARVAVGYVIDEDRYVGATEDRFGTAEITGGDISAWLEVLVPELGWVPVDVTPDESRVPSEEGGPGRTKDVASPSDPPEPPTPPDSDPLEQDEEEEELEEEEDEEEEEEEPASGFDFGWIATPVGIVSIALGGPLLLALMFCAAVIGWKVRRRAVRRRGPTPEARIAGAWAEVVDRFEETGRRPPPNATPHELIESFESGEGDELDAPVRSALKGLAMQLNESVFRKEPPTEEAAQLAWERADEVTSGAAGSVGLLERTKQRADPRPLRRRNVVRINQAESRSRD